MTVFVLFFIVEVGRGATSFQYEFKDKTQCQNAIQNMHKHFKFYTGDARRGYCQEVRK